MSGVAGLGISELSFGGVFRHHKIYYQVGNTGGDDHEALHAGNHATLSSIRFKAAIASSRSE